MNRTSLLLLAVVASGATAGWQDGLLDQLKGAAGGLTGDTASSAASALSNDEVVAGLKQALQKGAGYAVDSLGQADGFWGNPAVRIPMPEQLQSVEKILRRLGQGRYADEFVLTMNRAAEQAVPETLAILKQAVSDMSFADARKILGGPDNAATEYLRKVGGERIDARIRPIVEQATARTGVTSQYKALFGKLGMLGGALNPDDYDIDRYVTDKTADGLFAMIAAEEKKIREDPLARSTDLLKKVFAGSR